MISALRYAALALRTSRPTAAGKPNTLHLLSTSLRDVRSRAMSSMKAVVFDEPGGLEVLQYKDVEKPQPGQVRLGDVGRILRGYSCSKCITQSASHCSMHSMPQCVCIQQH
jgi:hypothetical protein